MCKKINKGKFLLQQNMNSSKVVVNHQIEFDIVTNISPFCTIGLFLYPLKTSENKRFSDVFRWYRKRPMPLNGLGTSCSLLAMHLSL